MLADNTDGLAVVGMNDLNAGFRRIADDLTGYQQHIQKMVTDLQQADQLEHRLATGAPPSP